MSQLIEALQIFLKYADSEYPTHCEHDVLYIDGINPRDVSADDKARLDVLGFVVSDVYECFISYHYGSS